ncbi:LLM class flavin-dependent oxidoreductase [Pseudomonas sp. GV071]|jgi:alkanesulfonate monooxygenase|uniref:LLM class flavin-dependent oxidoreductase n=1 Tax=Pseudomonas sp. GV071 TaxID=2135754 RepID=UPI000D393C0F|nr:LLM class flavin-dependent oxidoreductase [Pseudomonas sp. GV071]PTQ68995.1 alkanesulfonate monooxygenase [Pseudomonas sp. GV071]
MSIEFVGMVFPSQWSESKGPRAAGFDLDYLRHHARAHENAGFDRVLIASGPGGADSLQIAAFAAAQTERLGFMVAHRPALTSPTVAARSFATLDHTTGGGRIRLHAITGITAEPGEGDFLLDKTARYQRTDEYLEIVRRTWASDEPFDFDGKFFQLKGAFSPVKPAGAIPISFGGSSDIAYQIAVKHADLYALWGEPLSGVAEQIAKLRAAAQQAGVAAPRVSLSVRLILGATEELAWERAYQILAQIKQNPQFAEGSAWSKRLKGTGSERLLAAAAAGDRHDRALWMPTASAVGAYGDTTALVGTPETVAEALLDYVDLGVTTFLNRGYDPLYDTVDYGRWIIPAVREEARRRELARAS